jgi:ABC-2 type transport system permease protein
LVQQNFKLQTFIPGILVFISYDVVFVFVLYEGSRKEVGTLLEQINVTLLKNTNLSLVNYFVWVLGLILTVGLVIAKVVFSVPILGNIFLIYGFTLFI